jgi:hypothetical protein
MKMGMLPRRSDEVRAALAVGYCFGNSKINGSKF